MSSRSAIEDLEEFDLEVVIAAILGLLIGSFLNVVILRLPQNESIVYPASHCPKCKEPLKWWHNVPVLSWVFLQGKCYFCKEPISWQYPAIEIATAALFAIIFYKEELTFQAFIIAALFSSLLALSIIDLRFKAVPDSLNLFAATIALFASSDYLQNLQNAAIVAGALAMLRFYVSYYVSKKDQIHLQKQIKSAPWLKSYYPKYIMIEAMGEGDIIVGFAMGALLGLEKTLIAIFLAALTALPASVYLRIAKSDTQLPFIPFLAIGAFLSYLFGAQIVEWMHANYL